jgi:hypothetical protein
MTVLSALLGKRQAVHQGVDYAEQELLGAILAVVEKIQDSAEIKKAHIGIEVIIKVIRGELAIRSNHVYIHPASMMFVHENSTLFSFDQPSNLAAGLARRFRAGETHSGGSAPQRHAHLHVHGRERFPAGRRLLIRRG